MITLRVKRYLEEHGVNVAQLSAGTGITAADLESAFNGEHELDLAQYAIICEYLGVPLDTFLDSEDEAGIAEVTSSGTSE